MQKMVVEAIMAKTLIKDTTRARVLLSGCSNTFHTLLRHVVATITTSSSSISKPSISRNSRTDSRLKQQACGYHLMVTTLPQTVKRDLIEKYVDWNVVGANFLCVDKNKLG